MRLHRGALRYARALTPDKRRPGHIPGKNPGPSACARGIRTRLRFVYARISRRCPALRVRSMRASEESYRLYSCRGCARQVRICRGCDRGNQYCAGGCAGESRRESLRRAGARYQLSYRGASCHAARQSRWRARRAQKVTHQGSPELGLPVIVAATLIATPATHVQHDSVTGFDAAQRPGAWRVRGPLRCSFCRRRLSRFARWGFLHSGP